MGTPQGMLNDANPLMPSRSDKLFAARALAEHIQQWETHLLHCKGTQVHLVSTGCF